MASVASRERPILAELRPARIAIVAAGFMADGASQPAFADASWTDQGPLPQIQRISSRHPTPISSPASMLNLTRAALENRPSKAAA